MAALPKIDIDPTLDAIDRALEAKEAESLPRRYLGMSSIGRSCARELWFQFRWCGQSNFKADALKRFEDGHLGEEVQAERLRMVEGITLLTEDPRNPGHQFGYVDIGGHFRGHMDGAILGLIQAAKTWHVWEHKQVGDDKQKKLLAAKGTHGDKDALQYWDAVYYAQAVLYMDYSGLERHYLTCATAGGRHTISVRTDKNPDEAEKLKTKARNIIEAKEAVNLPRVSENPSWHECKFCAHHGMCYGNDIPNINCRTCCHSTPVMTGDGEWHCAKFNGAIPEEFQRRGCSNHVFIPSLIRFAIVVDADAEAGWIEYETASKTRFKNGPTLDCYTSEEMKKAGKELLVDGNMAELKQVFGGRVA